MDKVSAIILAAGQSRRMGDRNKLLLDVKGEPMIAKVVRAYANAISGALKIVTGFEHERVKAALEGLPVDVIHNPRFDEGQQSSVVAGLSQISGVAPTILGLGDQPLLRSADLEWLLKKHRHTPDKVTIPTDPKGSRGNPIVIPSHLRSEMLATPNLPGCRNFTRQNPDLVRMVETNRPGFFADIDTPEDYARIGAPLNERTGVTV